MLIATIRNGKVNGEVNGEDGEVNGEVKPYKLSKSEKLVYEFIALAPHTTRADMIEHLDISARTIDRAIKSLKDKNVIMRIGSDKTGHFIVVE